MASIQARARWLRAATLARRQAYRPVWWPAGHVGGPGVDGLLEGDVPVGDGVEAALARDTRRRPWPTSAIPQLGQGARVRGVMLSAVLGQVVDDVGVASDQGGERPARADRTQLMVVADEHQLGPGGLDAGGEARPGGRPRSCPLRRG